jgi:uncharacterized protein
MVQGQDKSKPGRSARPCPICNKMSIEKYVPFCSLRCANVDLHHWLKGSYTIEAEESFAGRQDGNDTDEVET